MNKRQGLRVVVLASAVFCMLVSVAQAQQNGKKSYTFRGKVEKVDATNKTLTINGEKVEGWMDAMSMTYAADKDDVFKKIKIGDTITAKVYEGDYKVLHDIQIVTDTKAPASPAKK